MNEQSSEEIIKFLRQRIGTAYTFSCDGVPEENLQATLIEKVQEMWANYRPGGVDLEPYQEILKEMVIRFIAQKRADGYI